VVDTILETGAFDKPRLDEFNILWDLTGVRESGSENQRK
jgi:hypothetical protein